MTQSAPSHSSHRPWIVEFVKPRCDNKQHADALQKVSTDCLHELIRTFMAAVLPDAEVLEPRGTPVLYRTDVFVGRTLASSSPHGVARSPTRRPRQGEHYTFTLNAIDGETTGSGSQRSSAQHLDGIKSHEIEGIQPSSDRTVPGRCQHLDRVG